MAIDSINKKLAVMEWGDYWEPALPLSPGALTELDDKWQLLWMYLIAPGAPIIPSSGGGRNRTGLLSFFG